MYEVESGGLAPKLLVLGGIAVHYVATSIATAALARPEAPSPGRRALAQWLPILATALAAVVMRQPDLAVALVFGSSVACLSLVLGMSTYVGPLQEFPQSRRLWPLVLPAALFALLAGFRGTLSWFHAVLLLGMGAGFLPLWTDRSPVLSVNGSQVPASVPQARSPALLVAAAALAGLAAWMTARGAVTVAGQSRLLTPQLLGSAVLSPFLLLPALGNSSMLAQDGRAGEAVTSLVGTVLLNLCLLLPIVVVVTYALSRGPTPYPLIVWRVDAVVLLVLAFAMLPVAAARWLPERTESMLLVLVYAAYLVFETLAATRMLG